MGIVLQPAVFLLLLIALTLTAWVISGGRRRRRSGLVRQLAGEWGMHFVQKDVFELARRVTPIFPIVGAALMVVRDIVYRSEGDRRHFVFTVEFTSGVLRSQRRERRVAWYWEPMEEGVGRVMLAERGAMLEQYRQMKMLALGAAVGERVEKPA